MNNLKVVVKAWVYRTSISIIIVYNMCIKLEYIGVSRTHWKHTFICYLQTVSCLYYYTIIIHYYLYYYYYYNYTICIIIISVLICIYLYYYYYTIIIIVCIIIQLSALLCDKVSRCFCLCLGILLPSKSNTVLISIQLVLGTSY